jgi:hypothetical protein
MMIAYTSVHKQQIHAELVGLLLHVPREANKITPVCAIVLQGSATIMGMLAYTIPVP